ncbi:hypothetical protein MMC27_001007 [Xylographa pallens]|nr:hypothetical protein [Xylographa pallens]
MNFNALCTVTIRSHRPNHPSEPFKVFHIPCRTLHHYLPLLPPTLYIDAAHLVPRENWDRHTQKAFLYLFTHIDEVARHHTSGALLQNLETSYKHAQRPTNHRPVPLLTPALRRPARATDRTGPVFDRLAYILHRYGSHPDLVGNMAAFFTRHCDALVRHDPATALMCLRGLSALGARMDSVLACLAAPRRNADTVLQLAAAVEAQQQMRILPADVQRRLRQLVEQNARRDERARGLVRAVGGGDGGRRRPRTVLRGDELALEELEALWLRYGHRIRVDLTGHEGVLGGGGYDDAYGDGYDDDDYFDGYDGEEDYDSAESEDPWDDVLPRRARPAYAPPRLRRRLEGRRQRSLGWEGQEMLLGGYGEGVGAGGYEMSEL